MPTGNFAAGDENNFVGKKANFQKIGILSRGLGSVQTDVRHIYTGGVDASRHT